MGCFLGCFGITKKKRRRKGGSKFESGASSYGRYVPLDSDVAVKIDNADIQKSSADKIIYEPKESTIAKVKKKVSFNLNVKTYEPLPKEDEETMWGYDEEETAGASMKFLNYEDNLMSSKLGSFPANYRYQNCRDTYDEEDDIELDEIDLDDDEDEDYDKELDFDEEDFVECHDYGSSNMSQVEGRQLNSAPVESDERAKTSQLAAQGRGNNPNQDLNKTEPDQSARSRSQFGCSVLNPIENLSQWKEVKANSKQQLKLQKENVVLQLATNVNKKSNSLPLTSSLNSNCLRTSQEISVNASLSNWVCAE
ncbi:OLC1v1019595C1 [Oldenlandia corymbosa var. corymbosa]|uniref:OLC1v1019595C1 n=1 Tax=Oldenlandia corymbosa var. corymbosa TaxID=529605 RepID=A0AAV1EEB8_OLDCO|nr:OLC1v1019595C1 [Oldenlandia corymbosa var. corymbosa]